jgi:hypothetical protein
LKAHAISSLLPGGQILGHRTQKWKYICGLFANGVVDTGSKFATELSTTLARLVEKFAAGAVLLIPVVYLDLQITPRIFKKI